MRETLIHTALGEYQPELVLKNGRILNVFSGEILHGDIAITEGHIAGIGEYSGGLQTVDLRGKFVSPGLIDAHCHVESSMVTPPVYCDEVVKWGVTTLITDPHEIVNVAGDAGVCYMLESSANVPVNYFVQLPSCVPATPFEHAGAEFTAEQMRPFLQEPHVLGLGEMMNYPGVAACDAIVMEKLRLFDGRVIDGHAPSLSGDALQAYAAAGIMTDHESASYEQAREKLRAGIAVLVREGSASKNLRAIITGVLRDGLDTARLAFCTDDKHLSDIRREGTIRYNVREAVAIGMPPVTAVRIATLNAASIYGLRNLGAIAPGYVADIVVFDDLHEFLVLAVYKSGKLVFDKNEGLIAQNKKAEIGIADTMLNSVNIDVLDENSFALPKRDIQPVIRLMPGQITTVHDSVPDNLVKTCMEFGTLCKIAVIERHHATGNIGVGLLAMYGLRGGAVATTVAHDSHNIIVVGDNETDMLVAVRELERVGGGYTLVCDGKVEGTLSLPIAGLMSSLSADEFIPELEAMLEKTRKHGISEGIDPYLTLSFTALPVIPEIRITDMGMFDVTNFSFCK